MTTATLPRAFVWRRVHSLMGLWLVLFLMEHLFVNSQAALWLGENGQGFVDMVNAIHNLPYLQVIEIALLGIPLLVHMVWGIKYLLRSQMNASRSDGSTPYVRSARNRAYSWQRITSWILLIGLIFHVTKFRFLDYPTSVHLGDHTTYLMKIKVDDGIYTLAERLDVTLYDVEVIVQARKALNARSSERSLVEAAEMLREQRYSPLQGPVAEPYDSQKAIILSSAQKYENEERWVYALERERVQPEELVAAAPDFGTASLLSVRETFKSPLYVFFYTIFVLAACFHAFNGLWTFLITWGWILKMSAQRTWVTITCALMFVIIFLGLASVWGTYWINLKY